MVPPLPSNLDFNFTNLPFANGKKEAEFHTLFPEIPESERLIRIFRCAIAKPTLLEGRMYVSEHHLTFKLHWPSKKTFKFRFIDITDIRKASFANVVPNAMLVSTVDEDFFFGSIINRDEKFSQIQYLWDLHVCPTSLFRKYPNLSGLYCICDAEKVCFFCQKLEEMNKNDPKRKLRASDCPSIVITSEDDQSVPVLSSRSSLQEGLSLGSHFKERFSRSESNLPKIITRAVDSTETLTNLNMEESGECECHDNAGFNLIAEYTYPVTLPVLWKEWYCLNSNVNIYQQFLYEVQKVTGLMLEPWLEKEVSEAALLAVEETGGEGYLPEFNTVKAGFHRRTERQVAVNHSIPFVPKSILAQNTFTVAHVANDKLGVVNAAFIPLFGISTTIKKCFVQTGNEIKMKLYLKVSFTEKGKISVPKILVEDSTVNGIKDFYNDFEGYFREKIRAKNPAFIEEDRQTVKEEIIPQPEPKTLKSIVTSYLDKDIKYEYLIGTLLVILLFLYSLVLLNLVSAVQKLQLQVWSLQYQLSKVVPIVQ